MLLLAGQRALATSPAPYPSTMAYSLSSQHCTPETTPAHVEPAPTAALHTTHTPPHAAALRPQAAQPAAQQQASPETLEQQHQMSLLDLAKVTSTHSRLGDANVILN